MTTQEKINFIKDGLDADDSRAEIQKGLKALFGSGVNNTVIRDIRAERTKKKIPKIPKTPKKIPIKVPVIVTDPTIIPPSQDKLYDAYLLLDEIKAAFPGAFEAWKGKYPAEFKRYTRFHYGNYLDFTEVVNDFFLLIKQTLELIK